MSIETILATLGTKNRKALKTFLANVEKTLKKQSDNSDALHLRAAVLAEWAKRHPAVTNDWTPGTQGDPRILMRNGIAVASVHRLEAHRSDNDGVYQVIVKGWQLSENFRHVDDARAVAEAELQKA